MSVEEAQEVLLIEEQGLAAVRQRIGTEFLKAVELIHHCPSRLIITGIGKSGIIGQKITATLNSTGTPSFFLHPVEAMHGDLGILRKGDVMLALSFSGESEELLGLVPIARRVGVQVVAMTQSRENALADLSDEVLVMPIEREACPFNMAPTTSTTSVF